MPTTITSAGVTFNDTTTLTSANIGTAQLVNGSVTAEKLGTTEQKQIAKAWVNFNGTTGVRNSNYNVSSITINSAGNYTISFLTNQTDVNYVAVASVTGGTSTAGGVSWIFTNPTISNVVLQTYFGNVQTSYNVPIQVAIFGN